MTANRRRININLYRGKKVRSVSSLRKLYRSEKASRRNLPFSTRVKIIDAVYLHGRPRLIPISFPPSFLLFFDSTPLRPRLFHPRADRFAAFEFRACSPPVCTPPAEGYTYNVFDTQYRGCITMKRDRSQCLFVYPLASMRPPPPPPPPLPIVSFSYRLSTLLIIRANVSRLN